MATSARHGDRHGTENNLQEMSAAPNSRLRPQVTHFRMSRRQFGEAPLRSGAKAFFAGSSSGTGVLPLGSGVGIA